MVSSGLPTTSVGPTSNGCLFDLAPGGVYPFHYSTRKGLYLVSVALSVRSHAQVVNLHPVLWSPDFPPTPKRVSDHLSFNVKED